MRIRYGESIDMQEIHDLMDGIHNIPEMLCAYGGWHVEENINFHLNHYDERWFKSDSSKIRMSLMQTLAREMEELASSTASEKSSKTLPPHLNSKSSLSMHWDVVVVGAGAAGLVAAERAAVRGRKTMLLERNRKPGVKILISGGTRCNLTHATDSRGIVDAYADGWTCVPKIGIQRREPNSAAPSVSTNSSARISPTYITVEPRARNR